MNKTDKIPVVWQISVLNLPDNRAFISGVLLKGKPFNYNSQKGNIYQLTKVIRSYFTKTYHNREINLLANGVVRKIKTDRKGAFSVIVNFHVAETPEVRIGEQTAEILQSYPIVFPFTTSSVDIISDVDDTIVISYTASFFKRIGTIIFTSPKKRRSIEFTQTFFNEIIKQGTQVYYVSKSEGNLFGIVSFFIRNQRLPEGSLFLTPYLSFSQLLKGGKEKDFKMKRIRFLVDHFPDKKFILFGDDTQKDMKVYTDIARQFPDRIGRIYIRQTKLFRNSKQKELWKDLKKTFPNSVYFDINTDIMAELKSIKAFIELQNKIV